MRNFQNVIKAFIIIEYGLNNLKLIIWNNNNIVYFFMLWNIIANIFIFLYVNKDYLNMKI